MYIVEEGCQDRPNDSDAMFLLTIKGEELFEYLHILLKGMLASSATSSAWHPSTTTRRFCCSMRWACKDSCRTTREECHELTNCVRNLSAYNNITMVMYGFSGSASCYWPLLFLGWICMRRWWWLRLGRITYVHIKDCGGSRRNNKNDGYVRLNRASGL